jgi:hypothetical protein
MKTPETASDLAKILGVTRQLIAFHRKKPDAPALGDVEGWRVFLAAVGREGSHAMTKELRERIGKQRLRLLRALARKAETANAIAEGKLIATETVLAGRKIFVQVFWAEIMRIVRDFPSILKGLNEPEIRAKLEAHAKTIQPRIIEACNNIGAGKK